MGLRIEGPLRRLAPDSPGAIIRSYRPYAPSHVVDFESSDGSWTAIRTLSFFGRSWHNNGMIDNLTTSISVIRDIPLAANKDKLSASTNKESYSIVPFGVKIGYGLSYYFPVGQSFAGFAQLKPPSIKSIFSFKKVFMAPQTMLTAGFHLPIITATSPTGHNISLKFSAAVDQQFRPIVSFTINLVPARH